VADVSYPLIGVGNGYMNLSEITLHVGDHLRTRFFIEEARERFERVGSRSGLADTYLSRGELERGLGNHREAEQAYMEAAARCSSSESSNRYFADLNVALLRCETRRFPEALALLERLRKQMQGLASRSLLPWIRLRLTTCLAHEGRWEELERELSELGALIRDRGLYASGTFGMCPGPVVAGGVGIPACSRVATTRLHLREALCGIPSVSWSWRWPAPMRA
jgi:tetratricopeptide (TPR) repeat protein